jgi:murein DD-endopeptidase MepM/ murein hydrolase activator NlpD
VLGLLLLAVPGPVLPAALAAPADELAAAQERANRAADSLSAAEEETARAEDTVAHLEERVARVDARVAAVRDQVRQLAIRQYVSGTVAVTRLLRLADANEVVRAQQYASVMAETSTDALEQYRADKEDLRIEVAALRREQQARAETIEDLRRREGDAIRELDRLARVHEQARAAQEEQRRQADAAAAASAARASAAAGPAATTAGSTPSTAAGGSPSTTARAAPARPPTTTRAPSSAPSVVSGEWICPVQGPRAFSNDYGAPRGGGSSHMGNDIMSPRGTPVVANVSGVVTQRNGAISGLAYFLAGDDGNRYFGAHLDSFGASGRVEAGTVIGRVGNTGDAASTPPHLHFEIHPGGSGYTNPYSTLTKYC